MERIHGGDGADVRLKKKMTWYKKETFLMIDAIARRYGVLPSTLRKLPVDDYIFDHAVAVFGYESESEAVKRGR